MNLEDELFDLLLNHGWPELTEPTMNFLREQGCSDLHEDESEEMDESNGL